MAISRRKTIATAFSLFLMFAMAASLVVPFVSAQPPAVSWTGKAKAYAYIGATPNPVGVGQPTLLHFGITRELQITQDGWEGITVTVTRPDQTTETLGPKRTDATGGTGLMYTPSMEGTYKLQTHFPAQWYNYSSFDFFTFTFLNINTYYEDADSEVLELVVVAEQQVYWPGIPLPTEYWTRPIDSQLREWAAVSASWLEPTGFGVNPIVEKNDDAPETAHILWEKPFVLGGLAGGDLGDWGTYTGDAYEGKFINSLIIQGVLIYRKFDDIGGDDVDNWIVAVDLHTGETLWEKTLYSPTTGERVYPSHGQIYMWDSFNAHGTHAYLFCAESVGFFAFGATPDWHAFDPFTGRWLFTMEGLPSGSRMRGPHGEILIYSLSLSGGYMTCWNSSAVIAAYWGTDPNNPAWGSWRPQGKIINATGTAPITPSTPLGRQGYQSNISIPIGLPGSAMSYFYDDVVMGFYRPDTIGFFSTQSFNDPPFILWAFDAKTGALKFNKTIAAPPGNVSVALGARSAEDRVITIWCKELRQHWGYSLDTGDYLWGPTPKQNYLDYLSMNTVIAYNRFYSIGMSGNLYCYNATTGALLWTYTARDELSEILWANDWSIRPLMFADGKMYLGQSEHSPVNPLPRGAPMVCIDALTGEEIWRADGLFRQTDWGGRAVMGDSIIATMDSYNQMIYAIGKGPSATTVSAAPKVSVHGSSVLVEGMVTDISPGTEQYARTARFPHGVPAVADQDMSDWMLYVYKQFPRPADVTGVEVVVEVLDPNNNFYEVGRATSDGTGFYSVAFTPEVPGKYTILASFAGSKAYYGSFAETAINVESAPMPTPPPTPTPAPMTDTYVLGIGAGAIVAIVVIGLVLILMLRKR